MSCNNFNGKLIVFSAPSGAGKTSIVKYLVEQDELNLGFSISATSRKKRGEEINGEDYYFLSTDDFKSLSSTFIYFGKNKNGEILLRTYNGI